MTTEFTNEHHEILFALFILKANHINYNGFISNAQSDNFIIRTANIVYFDVFRDRAICEPEHEGWVTRMNFNDYEWMVIRENKTYHGKHKITFKFEE